MKKHRSKKKKSGSFSFWLIPLFIAVLIAGVWFEQNHKSTGEADTDEKAVSEDGALQFWYVDDALTDFLIKVSSEYHEKTGKTVIPVKRSGLEYLEEINAASLGRHDEGIIPPDIYIISHDELKKACLSGLAGEVDKDKKLINSDYYNDTAIASITCSGKYAAYPLYFETSALLYNKSYIEEAGLSIPRTIEDILSFSDEYDAPEQVESVFKWDVTDIFYNYYFAGSYINVGGECGDDEKIIDIDNENSRECLRIYQSLNQFFSIDTKESTYEKALQDFIDGKTVMTVATSDALDRMEKAKEEGVFTSEYGMETIPDLNGELKGRSLSITYAIAVNGYSDKKNSAEEFISFLINRYDSEFYGGTGKLFAGKGVSYSNSNASAFILEYEKSIPMPKLLESGNYWVQLEACYSRAWDGEPVEELLSELQENMEKQIDNS